MEYLPRDHLRLFEEGGFSEKSSSADNDGSPTEVARETFHQTAVQNDQTVLWKSLDNTFSEFSASVSKGENNWLQSDVDLTNDAFYLDEIFCPPWPNPDSKASSITQHLKRKRPPLILAPDGYLPNSIIRKAILHRSVKLRSLKEKVKEKVSDEKVEELFYDRVLSQVAGDSMMSSLSGLKARIEAAWHEEARTFMRNVLLEERQRLDGLLSHELSHTETPQPRKSSMSRPRRSSGLMNKKLLLARKTRTSDQLIDTVYDRYRASTLPHKPSVSDEMPPEQFRDFLSQLISHVGSRSQVYQLISSALQRNAIALHKLLEVFESRQVRNLFLDTIRAPAHLFDFLTSLVGSRPVLRTTLSNILSGNLELFDRISTQIDSDQALFNFIDAYKKARREATVILQTFMPVTASSSSIIDMLLDGTSTEENIARLINCEPMVEVESDASLHEESAMRVTQETLEIIEKCLLVCGVEQLRELRLTINTPDEQFSSMRSSIFNDQSLTSQTIRVARELKTKLLSNSLIQSTISDMRQSISSLVIEPALEDFIALVNKGELFVYSAEAGTRMADELAIKHFSQLVRKIRHVISWSVITDPIQGQLSAESFEALIRETLDLRRNVIDHVEIYMAAAAKNWNVGTLIQKAVYGDEESQKVLQGLFGRSKCDFILRILQESQGRVIDRIARHCATGSKVVAIESILQTAALNAEDELDREILDTWIRIVHNFSQLAVKLKVEKSSKKTMELLVTKELQNLRKRLIKCMQLEPLGELKAEPRKSRESIKAVKESAKHRTVTRKVTPLPVAIHKEKDLSLPEEDESFEETISEESEGQLLRVKIEKPMVHVAEKVLKSAEHFTPGVLDTSNEYKRLEATIERAEFFESTSVPIRQIKTKPMETSFRAAVKKLTGYKTKEKRHFQGKVPGSRRRRVSSSVWMTQRIISPQSRASSDSEEGADSKRFTDVINVLNRILSAKREGTISRANLKLVVKRMQEENVIPQDFDPFVDAVEPTSSELASKEMANEDEISQVIQELQIALNRMTIAAMIKQSEKPSSPGRTRTPSKYKRWLSFMRHDSRLMQDTISSAARKVLHTPSLPQSDSEQPPDEDILAVKSALGALRTSLTFGGEQTIIGKLSEMQKKYVEGLQQFSADLGKETLLLDEQEMILKQFNTSLIEKLQLFFNNLSVEYSDVYGLAGGKHSLSALRDKMYEGFEDMTTGLPNEIKEQMKIAIDKLLEEIEQNMEEVQAASRVHVESPGERQSILSPEWLNTLTESIKRMFKYRLRQMKIYEPLPEHLNSLDLKVIEDRVNFEIERVKKVIKFLQDEIINFDEMLDPVNKVIKEILDEIFAGELANIVKETKVLVDATKVSAKRKSFHITEKTTVEPLPISTVSSDLTLDVTIEESHQLKGTELKESKLDSVAVDQVHGKLMKIKPLEDKPAFREVDGTSYIQQLFINELASLINCSTDHQDDFRRLLSSFTKDRRESSAQINQLIVRCLEAMPKPLQPKPHIKQQIPPKSRSLFARDIGNLKMRTFVKHIRNLVTERMSDPNAMKTNLEQVNRMIRNILRNMEIFNFPALEISQPGQQKTSEDIKYLLPNAVEIHRPGAITREIFSPKKRTPIDEVEPGDRKCSPVSTVAQPTPQTQQPRRMQAMFGTQISKLESKTKSMPRKLPPLVAETPDAMPTAVLERRALSRSECLKFASQERRRDFLFSMQSKEMIPERKPYSRFTESPRILPKGIRVAPRPSWISCRDWALISGGKVPLTSVPNARNGAYLKRGEEMHLFSSSLRTNFTLADVCYRGMLEGKQKLHQLEAG